jgi:hypothetical protein
VAAKAIHTIIRNLAIKSLTKYLKNYTEFRFANTIVSVGKNDDEIKIEYTFGEICQIRRKVTMIKIHMNSNNKYRVC